MRDSVLDDKKYILGQFIKTVLLVALWLMTMATVNAQDPMKAGAAVGEFVKKYENVKDVDCMTIYVVLLQYRITV